MCIAKVKIDSEDEFEDSVKRLRKGGYKFKNKPLPIAKGWILLWKNNNKKFLSKAVGINPTCREIKPEMIAHFCAGRRKTARQCKNGLYRIDPKGEVEFFETVKIAAETLGVRPMNIYKAANPNCSELKTAYGFEWTYKKKKAEIIRETKQAD